MPPTKILRLPTRLLFVTKSNVTDVACEIPFGNDIAPLENEQFKTSVVYPSANIGYECCCKPSRSDSQDQSNRLENTARFGHGGAWERSSRWPFYDKDVFALPVCNTVSCVERTGEEFLLLRRRRQLLHTHTNVCESLPEQGRLPPPPLFFIPHTDGCCWSLSCRFGDCTGSGRSARYSNCAAAAAAAAEVNHGRKALTRWPDAFGTPGCQRTPGLACCLAGVSSLGCRHTWPIGDRDGMIRRVLNLCIIRFFHLLLAVKRAKKVFDFFFF